MVKSSSGEGFLSTPSARRATQSRPDSQSHQGISIHALREEGDKFRLQGHEAVVDISIHALREEGDLPAGPLSRDGTPRISIHALREEGDSATSLPFFSASEFLSTPSARRATPGDTVLQALHDISIHARREEGDRQLYQPAGPPDGFLSTPSARRATISA